MSIKSENKTTKGYLHISLDVSSIKNKIYLFEQKQKCTFDGNKS